MQACPPSAVYRLRKFARRNKATLTIMACVCLMLAVVAGNIGWATRDREARRAEANLERSVRAAGIKLEVNPAIADAQGMQAQSKWPEAMAAAQRARGLLAGTEVNSELRKTD